MASDMVRAAGLGELGKVRSAVLNDGVDVNGVDDFGDSALHTSSVKGHVSIVKFLLANEADPNIKNKTESTPLHKAALGNHIKIIDMLIASGADANVRNMAGLFPEELTKLDKIRGLLQGDSFTQVTLDVAQEYHRRIIGHKGATIRSIREDTSVQINVPKKGEVVKISGRKEGVEAAVARVNAIVNEAKDRNSPFKHMNAADNYEKYGNCSVNLPLAKEKHRLVVGKKGQTIRSIQEEFEVKIIVPSQDDEETSLRVYGTQDGVEGAVKRIYECTSDKRNKRREDYDSPQNSRNGNGHF
eukprot:TRINITY_DN1943_c0_g1_i1.p1 TRINITY_DN1943_c0_g1~~TRINITY_DN1943_c0_g1_i1.p1  ORF type:complete len:327 (+),score=61.62 TRINITY_DN1943_c0_g1_i1:82-981(+)